MNQDELHRILGVGPGWRVIWEGAHSLPEVQHSCGGLYGPGGTYVSEYRRLTYTPTRMPGIEAAICERCREAWVRAV